MFVFNFARCIQKASVKYRLGWRNSYLAWHAKGLYLSCDMDDIIWSPDCQERVYIDQDQTCHGNQHRKHVNLTTIKIFIGYLLGFFEKFAF